MRKATTRRRSALNAIRARRFNSPQSTALGSTPPVAPIAQPKGGTGERSPSLLSIKTTAPA